MTHDQSKESTQMRDVHIAGEGQFQQMAQDNATREDAPFKRPVYAVETCITDEADKIDGLQSDLDSAIEVMWRRGDNEAREWIKLNYPKSARALVEEWK